MEITEATKATAEVLKKVKKNKNGHIVDEVLDDAAARKVDTHFQKHKQQMRKKLYGGRTKSILRSQAEWHQWRKRKTTKQSCTLKTPNQSSRKERERNQEPKQESPSPAMRTAHMVVPIGCSRCQSRD